MFNRLGTQVKLGLRTVIENSGTGLYHWDLYQDKLAKILLL